MPMNIDEDQLHQAVLALLSLARKDSWGYPANQKMAYRFGSTQRGTKLSSMRLNSPSTPRLRRHLRDAEQ